MPCCYWWLRTAAPSLQPCNLPESSSPDAAPRRLMMDPAACRWSLVSIVLVSALETRPNEIQLAEQKSGVFTRFNGTHANAAGRHKMQFPRARFPAVARAPEIVVSESSVTDALISQPILR